MNPTHVQFLRAVALRQPYQFNETGMTPTADGGATLSATELKNVNRAIGVLLIGAVGVGGAFGYLFARKRR